VEAFHELLNGLAGLYLLNFNVKEFETKFDTNKEGFKSSFERVLMGG